MGLEDLALFCAEPNAVVLYPCDAVSTWRATELAVRHEGLVYIRTTRPTTPVLYDPAEEFALAKSKVLRQGKNDIVTIATAGITVFEVLRAYDTLAAEGIFATVVDVFCLQPIDAGTPPGAHRTKGRPHRRRSLRSWRAGYCVARALAPHGVAIQRLAVNAIPKSGDPQQLLDYFDFRPPHRSGSRTAGRVHACDVDLVEVDGLIPGQRSAVLTRPIPSRPGTYETKPIYRATAFFATYSSI
jgi:transketolase